MHTVMNVAVLYNAGGYFLLGEELLASAAGLPAVLVS